MDKTDKEYDLTLESLLDKNGSDLSLLYPDVPKDYFKDKEDALTKKNGSVIENYNNAKIRPYVKIRDLNNTKEEPYANKSKPAIETGIEIKF